MRPHVVHLLYNRTICLSNTIGSIPQLFVIFMTSPPFNLLTCLQWFNCLFVLQSDREAQSLSDVEPTANGVAGFLCRESYDRIQISVSTLDPSKKLMSSEEEEEDHSIENTHSV